MFDFKDFLPIETAPFRFPFLMWVKSCDEGEPGIYVVQRFDSHITGREKFYLYKEGDTYGMPTIWTKVTGGWYPLPQEAFAGTMDYSCAINIAKEDAVSIFISDECVQVFNENGGEDPFLWWHNGRVLNYDELEAMCFNSIDNIELWY